jgi:hypothetical protein
MSIIMKYGEYVQLDEMSNYFLNLMFNSNINESKVSDEFNFISKKLSNDIKFNFGLIMRFGTGIKLMIPTISNLIEKSNLEIEMNQENLVLLTITVIAIAYLEETSNKTGEDFNQKGISEVTKKDTQTMLEELKMRGIGQGIVKKLVSAVTAIGEFFKTIFKGTPYVINGLMDMFGYTALLIPCMNAISSFIGKYDLTIESLSLNLLSLGIGIASILAKNGVNWLVNNLKNSLNLKNRNIDKSNKIDVDNSKLIKEQ